MRKTTLADLRPKQRCSAHPLFVLGYVAYFLRSLSLARGLVPVVGPPVHFSPILPAVLVWYPARLASSRIVRVFDDDNRAAF